MNQMPAAPVAAARRANLPHEAACPDGVLFEVINQVGVITLHRPKLLNALSHPMVRALAERLTVWADDTRIRAVLVRGAGDKAFCAGGDIRALHESFHSRGRMHHDFFVDEYQLDHQIHRYPKPCIAVMDGIVMGGGMGLAQGAALRIATERTRLAMPETGIGLIPDVGASHFLAGMPQALALYLGITGQTIGAADALYCGLADAYLPSAVLGELDYLLTQIEWTCDPLADVRAALLGPAPTPLEAAPLAALFPALERHFLAPGVHAIMAALAAEADPRYRDWAERTLKIMQTRSPLMMCVTREQLLTSRRLDLADCFRLELGLVHHCFQDGDFIEGVRALIVDKDNLPRWNPPRVEQVTDSMISRFFTSPWPPGAHPLAHLS